MLYRIGKIRIVELFSRMQPTKVLDAQLKQRGQCDLLQTTRWPSVEEISSTTPGCLSVDQYDIVTQSPNTPV